MLQPLRLARDHGFQFTLAGETGSNYTIEISADLITWQPCTNVPFTRPVEHFADPHRTNLQHRFYRAVIR